MSVTWRPRPGAHKKAQAAIFKATQDVFELDIKPEAVKKSPVTPEGLERNLGQGKKGVRAKGTGHNRQSIDVEVAQSPEGPRAKMFTQSGYGGYLELGTSKMRAQPYLWPALRSFVKNVGKYAKENMNG